MKKLLQAAVLLLIGNSALAQDQTSKPAAISIGGGISSTSSAVKQNTQIGNGYLINADVFLPFLSRGWDGSVKGSGKFALGIIAGGEYHSAKNLIPNTAALQSAYQLNTGSLSINSAQKGSADAVGFTGLAGLQADFGTGKVTFSPSVSAGYFTIKQDGFVQSSQVVDGTTQTIILSQSASNTETGFLIKPQLKIGYALSSSLSFYMAGAFDVGPQITSTQSYLVPAGGFNAKNAYEPKQLTAGTRADQSTMARYQAVSINAGLTFGFGTSTAGSNSRRKGKVIKSGDQGAMPGSYMVSSPGQPIGGIVVKGGKNPGGSMITVITDDKGGVEFNAAEAGNYKFTLTAPTTPAPAEAKERRTYTGGRRNEGLTAAMVSSPGSPIGGIVVKGGKNPGGSMITVVTNNNGEFEFKAAEAGNYKFTVTIPDAPEPAEAKEVRTYTGGRRNETSAPVNGSNLVSGSPIGGIVVKGGKNPGGGMVTVVTDDKGGFEFNAAEAGNYKFTITAPDANQPATSDGRRTYTAGHKTENAPAEKGISEKGIKRTEGAELTLGQPIGGIVVKGGKNPGGSTITVVSNSDGTIELNGLKAGNYKFIITAP